MGFRTKVAAAVRYFEGLARPPDGRVAHTVWRRPRFGPDGVTESFYPANLLRNLATELVETRSAFGVDVDFVPSAGLYAALTEYDARRAAGEFGRGTVFVIPGFEFKGGTRPSSKSDLLTAVKDRRAKPVLMEGAEPRSLVEFDPAHVWWGAPPDVVLNLPQLWCLRGRALSRCLVACLSASTSATGAAVGILES